MATTRLSSPDRMALAAIGGQLFANGASDVHAEALRRRCTTPRSSQGRARGDDGGHACGVLLTPLTMGSLADTDLAVGGAIAIFTFPSLLGLMLVSAWSGRRLRVA